MSSSIFVTRLTDLMSFAGKDYGELAEETGIERKSIYNWLRGTTYPNAKSLLVLANYFKVSIDYILGLEYSEEEKIGKSNVTIDVAQKKLISYLLRYMDEKGYTYYKLAKRLGVRQATLSRWFKVGAMPETAILMKIAALLDKPLDEILGRI